MDKFILWAYILNLMVILIYQIIFLKRINIDEWKFPNRIKGYLLIQIPLLIIFLFGIIIFKDFKLLGYILAGILGLYGSISYNYHYRMTGKGILPTDTIFIKILLFAFFVISLSLMVESVTTLFHFFQN